MPSPKSLAPGYVRVTYDGTLFPHHMTIPVNIPVASPTGVEPDATLKDASTTPVSTAISAMFDLIKVFYPSSVHFGLAEVHNIDATTGEDQFLYAWNVNKVGTAGGAAVHAAQAVFSFKTSIGSAYKLYLMESVTPVNLRLLPPYGDTPNLNMSNYIVGNTSPVYGRQNAYPFVPVSLISKTNDKLRKQQGLA